MSSTFTALVKRDGHWWVGWIKELSGVNSQGSTREELVENLRSALEEALAMNCRDAEEAAVGDFEELSLTV